MLAACGEGSGSERYNWCVTVKEELHLLIDGLTDEQVKDLLEDLLGSADVEGPPLDEDTRASFDRGARRYRFESDDLARTFRARTSTVNCESQTKA